MTELANAYVQLTVSTRGMQRDVESALRGIESSGDKTGKSLGQKISSGIGSTLKKGAVATGVAAGTALGAALTKGVGRLNAIEQAESKLTGLGHSASTVQGAMDSALKAVKGTAFGLDEAATTASMVMAAGIKPGQELEQVLTTVGDTAAIAGTSMSEMGDIFGKVAAKGKLQGDDLNRLTERGIPALQLLSEELGVTTEEAQKMASDGEISFEIFERAMRRGVGGAAQEMGNTTQGAFKNMMAAMGRFGATLAGPFFTQAGSVFRGLTDMFDNLDTRAGPVMERLGRWMTSTAVPALQAFGKSAAAAFKEFAGSSLVQTSLTRLQGVFTTLGSVGSSVGRSLVNIGSALAEAGRSLGVSAWQIFLSTLEAASAVLQALTGPLEAVSGFMKAHPGLVTAAVAAWTAFKTIPGMLGLVTAASTRLAATTAAVQAGAAKAATSMKGMGTAATVSQVQMGRFGSAVAALGNHVPVIAAMQKSFVTAAVSSTAFGANSTSAFTKVKAAASSFRASTVASITSARASIMSFPATVNSAMLASDAAFTRFHASVSRLPQVLRNSQVSLSSFAAVAKGAGAAAFTGIRTGVSGLVGALGGPLNVALMAAAGLLIKTQSDAQGARAAHDEMASSVRDGAAAQQELAAELAKTSGAMNENGLAAAARVAKGELAEFVEVGSRPLNIGEQINTATIAVDRFLNKIPFLGSETMKSNQQATEALIQGREAYSALAGAAESVGIPMSELNNVIAEGGIEFQALRASIDTTTPAGQAAAAALDGARASIVDLQNAVANSTPGMTSLIDAFGILADSTASSDEKLAALKQSLIDLGIITQPAAAAVADLTQKVDGIVQSTLSGSEAFAGLGQALLDGSGNIDAATTGGAALVSTIQELGDQFLSTANQTGDAGAAMRQVEPALQAIADATGLPIEKVRELAAAYGGITPEVSTMINLNGATTVTAQVEAIRAGIDNTDGKSVNVAAEMLENGVQEKLESIGYKIEEVDGQEGVVRISATDTVFREKEQAVMGALGGLGGMTATPTIDGNKVPLDEKVTGAGGQLLGLTGQSANPTIGANKTPFDTSIWGANSQLFGFDQSAGSATLSAEDQAFFGSLNSANLGVWGFGSMYAAATLGANANPAHTNTAGARNDINSISSLFPIATLDANGQPAHTNTSSARTDIESINRAKGTGKLDADNSSVQPNVSSAQRWIDGLLGRTVTVTFKAVYEGFRDMIGGGNFRGGAWDGTRALPGFATGGNPGYRLPTSGPGTNVTDGFVAFDSNNVPAARLDAGEWIINRRNSEKYNKELAQINAGTFPKLPGYADGGKHGIRSPKQMLDFVWNRTSDGQSRALDGAPYDWAGINWGDCSGAMSAIARFAVGLAPFAGRFATGTMRESLAGMGFTIGRGRPGDLRFGWWNGGVGGGHTFGTLPDGTHVEMRGGGRGGIIGKDAWPWNHPQATDHAFLPMPSFKFAGASGLDAFKPPTIGGAAETSTATGGMGAYAASQAGYSGGGKDNTPKTWSDVAGQSAYNFVSGMTEDALGVFGVPNDLPPLLQAYNMMQDAEEHGGVSTWDVSQAAAKLKQYEAEIELRKRVVAEGKKAVDLLRDSNIGDPGIGVLSTAENKFEDEVKLLRKAAENADLAKARLDELLETREAAAAAKQAGSGVSGMSNAALGQEAGGLGEFPNTDFPDNIDREIVIKYDPAGGAEQWRPMVIAAMKRQGMHAWANDPAIVDKFIRQIDSESKGDPNIAQQIVDVNGTGDAAGVGLGQIIPTTFAASRDPELPDDRRNPWSNLNAMVRYVRDNNKLNVIGNGHGYWKGGQIPFGSGKRDDVPLVAAEGEYIVNRFAAARNRGLLEDINSGRSQSEPRGGDTFNVYSFDLESSLRKLDRRQKQRALSNFGVRG